MDSIDILSNLPVELVARLSERYRTALIAYQCRNWTSFGSDFGRFIEIVFRLVEWRCRGVYTPLDAELPNFTADIISGFESTPKQKASDGWRLVIPRTLQVARVLRNSRGDVHETAICSNFIDSEYMCAIMKWILCEIIRLESDKPQEEILKTINRIETRNLTIVWSGAASRRVLCQGLTCRDQVLILLYSCNGMSLTVDELLRDTEYVAKSRFRNSILSDLHKERLIEYNGKECILLPTGIEEAEQIIIKLESRNGKKRTNTKD